MDDLTALSAIEAACAPMQPYADEIARENFQRQSFNPRAMKLRPV